jgi:hypothetical protein
MQSKPWYQSKTLYLNLITGIIAVLALPTVLQVVPTSWMPAIGIVDSIGNWVLRVYFTNTAIVTAPAAPTSTPAA